MCEKCDGKGLEHINLYSENRGLSYHMFTFKPRRFEMTNIRPFEITILACALAAGIYLFVRVCLLSNAVPMEYRSASPGFNWGWEIDYERATRDAGRYGEKPWPWPATKSGSRMILPLNQPLLTEGLKITYQGMVGSDGFRLGIVIQSLDSGVTYPQEFSAIEARNGFSIADQRFVLEKITPRYLLLSSVTFASSYRWQ